MADRTPHRCDERCTCPIHGTPLYYAPSAHVHACQDSTCEHAGGLLSDVDRAAVLAARRAHLHPGGRAQYVEERLPPVTDAIRDAMRKAAELLPFPEGEGVIGRLNLALIDIENTYGRGRRVGRG